MDLETRDQYVEMYRGSIRREANILLRRLPRNFELEELISVGIVAALEAAERYKPGSGAFWSFSRPRVRGAMRDFVGGAWNDMCHVELPAVRVSGEPLPDEVLILEQRRRVVRRGVLKLSPRERSVIYGLYVKETKRQALGMQLKISQGALKKARDRGVQRLKDLVA